MEALIILIVTVGGYLLPTIIAAARQRQNVIAIGALNLLLGWTLLGWVVALVWALTQNPSSPVTAEQAPSAQGQPVRSVQDSEANLSRARVWIAVIAVIAGLWALGHYSTAPAPDPAPPDDTSQQD